MAELETAERIFRELEAVFYVAVVQAERAEHLLAAGRNGEARELVADARETFARFARQAWLERVGCARPPASGRLDWTAVAQAPVLPRGFELPLKQRLPRIGAIDQVAVEGRAADLAKRSIKKDAKVWALELAIRCCDLTTLEGQDTPGKVAALCSKAIRPDPSDANVPSVAAICVYPNLIPAAKERLAGSGVKVASVATAFPSGQSPLDVKLRDVEDAVAMGADEIDMVIDRGAFLSGRYAKVFDEIVKVKEACGDAHLKVILEVARARHVRQRAPRVAARDGRRRRTSSRRRPGSCPARRRCRCSS